MEKFIDLLDIYIDIERDYAENYYIYSGFILTRMIKEIKEARKDLLDYVEKLLTNNN